MISYLAEKILNILKLRDVTSAQNHFVRRQIANIEKYKFLFKVKFLNYKNVILVFDCKVSPGTIGDFFSVLILSRVLESFNLNVKFLVITGEYRNNWPRQKKTEIVSHLKYLKYLSKKLSLKNKTKMTHITWKKFNKDIDVIKDKKTFILFEKKVFLRRPIYTHAINIMNYLLNKNIDLQNKVLLKENNFKINLKKENFLKKKYITLGCRRASKKIGTRRNLNKDIFIKQVNSLKKYFPDYNIVIISDKTGCNYFKKISKKYKLDCGFSKNHSPDFFGDGKVILKSSAFFQIDGGGILLFPVFSRLPFLTVHTKNGNFFDLMWSKENEQDCSWHKKNQLYLRLNLFKKKNFGTNTFFQKLKEFQI